MIVRVIPGKKGAQSARDVADGAGAAIDKALEAMDDIARSSAEIDGALAVLDDIVARIGMLAANAEAEAAQPGDLGKEFAAVATEIRGLAKRAARAAEEINGLAGVSSPRMSRADFLARAAPAIQGLAADAAALTELMAKIGLSDPPRSGPPPADNR